jgi:MEMO1 family protein
MLVFAAITPHSPLLTPSFDKKEGVQLDVTKKALKQLEQELYLSKAETVIIISPHGQCLSGAFTINLNTECQTDYTEIGDLATKHTYPIDVVSGTLLKEHALGAGFEIQMITEEKVDHGIGVPLQFLSEHIPNLKVVPIGVCGVADTKTHFNFGYTIKEAVMDSDKPIAIIASADLSHSLTTGSPAGFKKEGAEFDKKIQEALASGNSSALLGWDKEFVDAAASCGFKPIVTLLGALQRMQYTYKAISYEAPHGVGYLTADFSF